MYVYIYFFFAPPFPIFWSLEKMPKRPKLDCSKQEESAKAFDEDEVECCTVRTVRVSGG